MSLAFQLDEGDSILTRPNLVEFHEKLHSQLPIIWLFVQHFHIIELFLADYFKEINFFFKYQFRKFWLQSKCLRVRLFFGLS